MLEISRDDIVQRIQRDNPWWESGESYRSSVTDYPRRIYFEPFCKLAQDLSVKRAVVLMGPRRVGKTVMLRQLVEHLIKSGVSPKGILYASIDAPIYSHIPLEKFLEFFPFGTDGLVGPKFVIFDEIQYLKNWERHLKDLVDSYPSVKFIASGSAAAALLLASTESGAGRFSDFRMPPLTFAEFLHFIGRREELIFTNQTSVGSTFLSTDISELNKEFVNYLNYGGYPEAVLSPAIRENADQFVKNDIIDKVLLKDLPALYGIQDIQELNRLFAHLAYNTGQEVSLQSLSEKSGVSKPTIARYIEYLESAFLITKVSRLDQNAARFKRETHFKTYLTNPSMRAALYAPVAFDNSAVIGHLAESAVFSQWSHLPANRGLFFARWPKGEIDVVYLSGAKLSALWALEVKWSDRAIKNPRDELQGLVQFVESKKVGVARFTTLTQSGTIALSGASITYSPTSLYCYTIGQNITHALLDLAED